MNAIQDPLNRLEAVPARLRLAHIRATALRGHIAELEIPAMIGIENGGTGDTLNPSNNLNALVSIGAASQVTQLIAAEKLLALIEKSADFIEAVPLIEPLLELAAADVAEIEEADRKQREAETALDDAERAAREKLAAKVQADPNVQKARQALAGIRRLGRPLDREAEDIARELATDHH
jgi:hypothetical protein